MKDTENTTQKVEGAAIAAIAAASKTPFKTAFMVTMGMFAAHLLAGLISLSVFAGFIYLTYSLLK